MLYRRAADLVLLLHLAFVVFVAAGGLLVLRWRRLAWLHVPVALWGMAISYAGFVCPLTPLENRFRRLGGEAGYDGGFIEHYVTAAVYPSGLTRGAQLVLGSAVFTINAFVYWRVLAAWRRERGRIPPRGAGDASPP